MAAAPVPKTESQRLQSLVDLNVLDSEPEREFDALAHAAAALCRVPISLISLIDAERQWFKANVGLSGTTQTPRDMAFCAHAIRTNGIMEVPDTTLDPRFAQNNLVTSDPSIRFYAGATLRLSDGAHVGTLCVIDRKPRRLSAKQREVLGYLAAAAVQALEGRRALQTKVRAEGLLSESEARFRALSDASPIGVFAANAAGSCTYTNGPWQSIYAMTLSQSLERGWADKLHRGDRAAVFTEWQRANAANEPFEMSFRIQRGDNDIRLVRTNVRAVIGPEGGLAGYVGSVEDITESHATAKRLASSEHHLLQLYQSTPAMLHSVDPRGRLMTVSNHWLATLGYARDEVLGRPPTEFLTDQSRDQYHLMFSELLTAGFVNDAAYQMVRKNGEVIDVRLSAVVERDSTGQVDRCMAVIQDVTQTLRAERALHDERVRLSSIIAGTGAGTWEWNVQTGQMKFNEEWAAMIGHTLADLGPSTLETWISRADPDDIVRSKDVLKRHIAGELPMFDLELRMRHRDGHWIWVQDRGRVFTWTAEGKPEWMFGTRLDISRRKQQEAALRKSEQLLHRTSQVAGVGGWELDLVASTLTWSEETRRIHQVAPDYQPKLEQAINFYAPEARPKIEAAVNKAIATGERWDLELPLISLQGRRVWVRAIGEAEFEAGQAVRLFGTFQDITKVRELSVELKYRATHDALTGLVNRTEFESRLCRVLQTARDEHTENALLFVDLDEFKLVNDACGHSAGDQVLQQVSKLIRETVRARDTVARLGGDEFAIILERCTTDQAQRVAQQICERMDEFRFAHDARRFRIGASIGLVPLDRRWSTTAAIVKAADASCYAAKEAGRNRVHVWIDTDHAIITRNGEMQWAARLERALDEDRFVLYAQRIEALQIPTHKLHAEALLRMIDDAGQLVAPGAFLPAAERFHLASRVDRWVLCHSIDHLKSLADLSDIDTLCINLSGQSIGDRAFHLQAIDILTDAGSLVCERICLEITETAAVTNMAEASIFVEQVRALGVRVALDDFGAGASSFGYLRSLTVDVLKIDGKFIRGMINDPLDDVAVRCFVDVARVVGVKTVAEFVDHPDLLTRAREIGIDYAQGYLLHRPEPIENVISVKEAPIKSDRQLSAADPYLRPQPSVAPI